MLTFLSLADAKKPRWIVWENVPGVLSSNGGKDFATFLGALGELGYRFAYRILDAQHFGVAQRRRRVFVVGYLGDWRPAAAVLFERESLQRDSKPSRVKRKETATDAKGGVGATGFAGNVESQVAACLQTTCDDYSRADGFNTVIEQIAQPVMLDDQGGLVMRVIEDGVCGTLRRETHGHEPCVAQPIAVDWRTAQVDVEMTGTLKTDLAKMSGPCIAVKNPTIIDRAAFNQGQNAQYEPRIEEGQTMSSLVAKGPHAVQHTMAIRRLTPKECERLQGFPELKNICNFTLWLDPQKGLVNVAIKCRKKQIFAAVADKGKNKESALYVNQNFQKDQERNESVAELNVLTSYDQKVAEIHKIEKSLSNALNAELKKEFLQHIQTEGFARQLVGISTMLEKKTHNGREELLLNTMHFTQEQNGRILALLFGQEKKENAKGAEIALQEAITFIISSQGQSFQNFDMNCQTWLFFVLSVIGLFTHDKTQKEIFFNISTQSGWTQIPYRNKPADQCPDGPRYKACGNSMAVPVMRWIGQRIQLIDTILNG